MTNRVAQRQSTSSRSHAPAYTRRSASAGVMCVPLISLCAIQGVRQAVQGQDLAQP